MGSLILKKDDTIGIKETMMEALIRQIQKSLSSGKPVETKPGELASRVLDEIKKRKKEPPFS